MSNRRIPTWVILIAAVVGLILVIPGLWVFVSVTATPLFPNREAVPTVPGSPPVPRWAGAVEKGRQMVRESVAGQNLPGLSVAIGIDGELVWAEGFGFADLKSSERVTPSHQFRIGTASTVLTSAAAGLLLESGRLKLDEDIQTYVPAFAKEQQPVTLRELMSHTRGLTPDDNDEAPLYTQHCERPAEAVEYFKNWLYFGPEPGNPYSIYDWIFVSAAIERAAGEPLLRFMRKRVFDPLGMRGTVADPSTVDLEDEDFPLANMVRELIYDPDATRGDGGANQPVKQQVTPYSTRFRSDPKYGMHSTRPLDYSCYAGSSGLVSTPSDLVRFGMALNEGKLLQAATVDLLQTSQGLGSGDEAEYGLGWELKTVTLAGQRAQVAGHNGDSFGGTVASFMTFPKYGITVAATSNIAHADTQAIVLKIAELFVEQGRIPARQ